MCGLTMSPNFRGRITIGEPRNLATSQMGFEAAFMMRYPSLQKGIQDEMDIVEL